MQLNLSKFLLFGFANFLFLSAVESRLATAQIPNQFFCQSHRNAYSTFARSSLGTRSLIIWAANRQPKCDEVSDRFQRAADNGNLRFLCREDNLIYGTDRLNGECITFLFAVDTDRNAESLRSILGGGSSLGRNPIDGRFITQSANQEYFNLELYLNTAPISPDQVPSLSETPNPVTSANPSPTPAASPSQVRSRNQ